MSGRVVQFRSRRVSPRLVVTIPIEGEPTAAIVASSFEDERRLLLWLQRSDALDRLPYVVEAAVEAELDDEERGAA